MRAGTHYLLPLLATMQLSAAFTPTKLFSGYGWVGVSHWEQTEKVLLVLTKTMYENTDIEGDSGFKQARKDICDANAAVDDDQHHAEKHMGGESFPHGQQLIMDLRRSVKTLLQKNDVTGARVALGESLHTLQDFYSHSNWVELGNTKPHDQLGKVGGVMPNPPRDVPTCQDCNSREHFWSVCYRCENNLITPVGTGILTSGYFHDENYVKPTDVKKCSHGGLLDKSTTMAEGGINKDTINCLLSPHNHLHYTAVDMSEEATRLYIKDVLKDLTKAEQDALLGRTKMVVVASAHGGTTQPQGDNGPAVNKRSADQNTEYLLEPLESFSTGAKSTDVNEFHTSMKRHSKRTEYLDVEAVSLGMLAALHHVPTGGHFMIHSSSELSGPHDAAIANLAARRRIRISFITADSGHGNRELALSSGGHVVHHEAVDALTSALTSPDAVTIYTSPKSGKHEFPVDSSVSHLHFASSSSSSTDDLEITRPDGTTITSRDEAKPIAGTWTVSSSGPITVTGRSSIRIDEFALMQRWGRPAHEGYFAVQQQVLSGASYTAVTNFEGNIEKPIFSLTGQTSGQVIPLDMVKYVNVTDYFANVTMPYSSPRESYIFSMSDVKNNVLRTWPVPVHSSPVSVKISSIVIENADVAEVKVQVTSNESGRYGISALVNNPAYSIVPGGEKQACSLSEGETKEFTVEVKVPKAEKGSASISIIVKKYNSDGGDGNENAVVTSRVLPWAEKNHRAQLR